MRYLLDTVWQRRGVTWIWDEEARNQVCMAREVWSLRQLLRAVGQWPDDLPSNDNSALVAAGLDGCLDLLSPADAEVWLGDAIKRDRPDRAVPGGPTRGIASRSAIRHWPRPIAPRTPSPARASATGSSRLN